MRYYFVGWRGLCHVYFFHTALVPSALEFGVKKRVDNGECYRGFYVACWQDKHVCIVMCACQGCQFHIPANCRPYAFVFVQCHGNAVSCAAYAYCRIAFAILYCLCTGMCVIGIVATVGRMAAKVGKVYILALQIAFDNVF